MTEYQKILKGILENRRTWEDIKSELSKYNIHNTEEGEKDTRAGKIFEVLTQLYFQYSPIEKDNFINVWLFEEVPTAVRNKLNLGNQDYGADLILEDIDRKFYAVQCKFKNNESTRLNWTSDKIANLFAFCPNADHYVVFTNAADLDEVSKTRYKNFTLYSVTNLQEIKSDIFHTFYEILIGLAISERVFFEPKPHQKEAIKDCINFFEIEERGQLILPCGAGKTYTALWIKEGLESKNCLVLVPSLALLRQIKNEWANQRKSKYQYICVCSESDIDKDATDSIVTHTYEIDIRVTTDPIEIEKFLAKDYPEKVIFSTYHSLQSIADAIKGVDFEFDFIFCDEAHKTAGVGMNKFSLVHDNRKIPSKRRLYATATPRIVKESLKKKLGDDLKYAYDMNDPETFGHEFYRMSFKDAIEQDILVDYKIVAVGVNNEELKEYIERRRFVDAKLSIDEIANNYALDHIMNKYSVNHSLTFHSRVKLASEFANRHSLLFPETSTFSVSGEQPTSQRNIVLNDFKNSDKAIVSNARCLTEGVDVPTIDLVYFCDPKNSKVDIVQAVGRALRKKKVRKSVLWSCQFIIRNDLKLKIP
ncbi:DEAD/DEAH box helicase family protein [Fulvivirga maritima]|uniref:DEAD/DEAH box helicase family protein n=1 Tax=Fulvivirga maritima TaxID=2904247 RepID=UPI001F48CD6B|nr:DEAD/DEAH box helicase family protein [Fulvivirga maritima]UII29057.1 DEAD/DEAH box helicase family protein [Fulvivirga maritima]